MHGSGAPHHCCKRPEAAHSIQLQREVVAETNDPLPDCHLLVPHHQLLLVYDQDGDGGSEKTRNNFLVWRTAGKAEREAALAQKPEHSLGIHECEQKHGWGTDMGTNKKFGVDSCFLKSGGDLRKIHGSISRQEAVWFHPISSMSVMVRKTCALHHASGLYTDVNMWYRSDENARENLKVMMLSAALHPHSVKKFNRIIQAEFEHHLQHKAVKRIEFSVLPYTGITTVRDCAANRIIYPDYQMEAVHLSHFNRLLLLSGYFLLFCFLVLASEMMRNMNRIVASKKMREARTMIRGRILEATAMFLTMESTNTM